MALLFFIYGIVIGSFLNVCIYRIPKEESIIVTSSHCTCCLSKIKFYDLIPLVSYIILRGKCRNCGNKISIKYPVIELITGILYLLVYEVYGLSFISFKYIIMISFLIVISMIDYETQDVYIITTYPCIFIGILLSVGGRYYFNENISNDLLGLLVSVISIGFIVLITKGKGMGAGDIEIAAICGIYLGLQNFVVTLFLAFIIGAIYGVVLIILKSRKRKEPIAFGPFLFLGALIALFYGGKIIELYVNFIFAY